MPLADLLSAAIPLTPQDAAAIVRRLCARPADAVEEGAPHIRFEDVRLHGDGTVSLSGGVRADVARLGALLDRLLGEVRRTGVARVPPGLVLTAALATGQVADAAPFRSPAALATALARFEPPDPVAALRALFAAGQPAHVPADAAPVASEGTPRRRSRSGALAAAAAIGFAAGIAAMVMLEAPGRPPDRVRVATELIVAPLAEGAPEPAIPATRDPEPLLDPRLVNAAAVFSPSFSANGSTVFFHAESGGSSALKRAERGRPGGVQVATIVDDAAKNYHVQVSPDGEFVAFDSDRDGVRGVYVADAQGRDARRVSGSGYAAAPTWAPDGRRLAFLRAESERANVWNLWVADLRSGEMTRLTRHRFGQVWSGAWFPDGRRVAYSHEDRLFVLELGSGRATAFASPRKGRLVRTPAVSPDGRWIVFQVFRDGAWLLDVEDGSMQRLLADPTAEEFTWAPDGRQVAFHSRRGGRWGLWVMAAR